MKTEDCLVTRNEDYNFVRYLPFVLGLSFVSEALTKIGQFYKFPFYNFSAVVKLVFIFVAFYFIIKWREFKLLTFMGGMGVIFLLGQLSFNHWEFNINVIGSNSIYFGRFMLIFFLVAVFRPYQNKFSQKVFLVFEYIVIINSLLIIFGYFFNITLFKTYLYRFGYNGLFMTPTMISYLNALAITYFIRKIGNEHKGYLPLILVVFASLLTGTKAILLFVLFTCIHLVFKLKLYQKRIFLGGLILLFSFIVIFWKQVLSFLQNQYSVLYDVYVNDGLISMLTSYRNHNLIEIYNDVILGAWFPINYFFGGTDFDKYRVEFDFLDVFLFFGLVGGLIYLWVYFSKVINFNKFDKFSTIQILGLLFIGVLAGTFFNGAPLMLYLVVVLNYLYFKE